MKQDTMVPTELLDDLTFKQLTGDSIRVAFYLIGKTYRYDTNTTMKSIEGIMEGTGLSSRKVCNALKQLQEKNILQIHGKSISFNYEAYIVHKEDEIKSTLDIL